MIERTTQPRFERTAPLVEKPPPIYIPAGKLWDTLCSECGMELQGAGKPEKDCDYTCSLCLTSMCENPKAKEMAEYRYKEAEKAKRLREAKTKKPKKERPEGYGEKVVDRSRRLQAERGNLNIT